mmetsp:Transcript_73338/g.191354  ORF Transcript_73338/g.191354 Transcript_73338/m.191354 type:complete len:227 (+) Transcript_73338:374-1054(+)
MFLMAITSFSCAVCATGLASGCCCAAGATAAGALLPRSSSAGFGAAGAAAATVWERCAGAGAGGAAQASSKKLSKSSKSKEPLGCLSFGGLLSGLPCRPCAVDEAAVEHEVLRAALPSMTSWAATKEAPAVCLPGSGTSWTWPSTSLARRALYQSACTLLYLSSIFVFLSMPLDLKYSTSLSLPPDSSMAEICLSVHESIATERTKDRCTPRERWTPEHSRHIRQP